MRQYELVYILSPALVEAGLGEAMEQVSKLVVGRGGQVTASNVWGKRRLAFPLQKFNEGNYVVAKLQLEPDQAKELEHSLRLREDILRHMLVRLDEA